MHHPLAYLVPLAATLSAGIASAAVLSGPITNPANGHDYYLLTQGSYPAAEAEAVTLGGHLVTINDAAENQWVYQTFGDLDGVGRNLWIGYDDLAVEGTFTWTSGETPGYTNWTAGEPNDTRPGEDATHIWIHSVVAGGFWNDSSTRVGSTIRPPTASFGGTPFGVVEVVPEPAAITSLGLLGLALTRRRR